MLLVQITNDRIELAPDIRTHHKTAGRRIAAVHWGQLEKITAQHHLHAAKRPIVATNLAQYLIDHIEPEIMQHRNFIDDQHVCFLDGFAPRLAQIFVIARRQRIKHANAAPSMNGRAV